MALLDTVIGAIIGGGFAALSAYLGVRQTLTGQADRETERRKDELAAIRLALRTEVGMIAQQCVHEYSGWSELLHQPGSQKNPRTAHLPPLKIYDAMTRSIGRLSRDEIVALIKFTGTVSDIGAVSSDVAKRDVQSRDDQEVLTVLFSNACGYAATCLKALPAPDSSQDAPFIEKLEKIYQAAAQYRRRPGP